MRSFKILIIREEFRWSDRRE